MTYILPCGPFGLGRKYIERLFNCVYRAFKVTQRVSDILLVILSALSKHFIHSLHLNTTTPNDMYSGVRDTMSVLLTPPMAVNDMPAKRRKVHVDELDDFDEESINELLNNYAPLSNLPTPPLSAETSPKASSLEEAVAKSDMIYTEPARVLVDIIRIREKCVPAMQASHVESMLQRAGLDRQTIAFAACILYRLSWRFVRDWKNELLARQASGIAESEVIVLAALYMASSWLSDRPRSVRFWVEELGSAVTTKEAFLASQFCILNDPSTNLMQISAEEVEDTMEDLGLLPAHDIEI